MRFHQSNGWLGNQRKGMRWFLCNVAGTDLLRIIYPFGVLSILAAAYTAVARDLSAIFAVALYFGLLFNKPLKPAKGQTADDEGSF